MCNTCTGMISERREQYTHEATHIPARNHVCVKDFGPESSAAASRRGTSPLAASTHWRAAYPANSNKVSMLMAAQENRYRNHLSVLHRSPFERQNSPVYPLLPMHMYDQHIIHAFPQFAVLHGSAGQKKNSLQTAADTFLRERKPQACHLCEYIKPNL